METGKEVVKINLNSIIPNRFQPRISFDEQALTELSNSIKMYGILQPLILRPLGDKYEIIAGERRYKAATQAGLTEVPAILVNLDDQTSAELAIIENIQRKDLTAIEEAKSYKKLLDLGNYTQEQLSVKMGKSQSAIANKLRLLNLLPETQNALINNSISERHARSLLQLKDEVEKQKEVLNKIINERLTVKETDDLIKSMLGGSNLTMNENNFISSNIDSVDASQGINYGINNSDTFNLNQISNPNLEIPTTPSENDNLSLNPAQNPNFDAAVPSNLDLSNLVSQQTTPNFDSLLKVEGEKATVDAPKEEIPKFESPTAPLNRFFPSLENTPANFSFDNPYQASTSVEQQAPVEEPNPNLDNNATVQLAQAALPKVDLNNAITNTREMVKNLETTGYKVTTEELDLPDVYQITIKINKNN